MIRYSVLLFLGILQIVGCGQDSRDNALTVTYIANEGFMVAMGTTTVLIDALPNSKYYVNPSDTLAARMIRGIPPFDKVDYFLVTHDHADHFNAEMLSRFLLNHPAAQLVASSETCGRLVGDSIADRRRSAVSLEMGQHATIRGDKAEITVMRLEHGGGPGICNLAYFVRSNGYTILHVGDAKLSDNEKFLERVDWSSYAVDLLFLEFFDQSSSTQKILEDMIKPKHVILMHIPAGEETSVRNVNAKIYPRTVVFEKESETRRFDNGVDGEPSR